MGVLCEFGYLKHAVIHDINTLERYDDEVAEGHVLSAIVFKNDSEMESGILADILKKASRKSDILFYENDGFVILMPATKKEGAKHIFDQMHDVCRQLDKLTILTYPEDAFIDDEFYKKITVALEAL